MPKQDYDPRDPSRKPTQIFDSLLPLIQDIRAGRSTAEMEAAGEEPGLLPKWPETSRAAGVLAGAGIGAGLGAGVGLGIKNYAGGMDVPYPELAVVGALGGGLLGLVAMQVALHRKIREQEDKIRDLPSGARKKDLRDVVHSGGAAGRGAVGVLSPLYSGGYEDTLHRLAEPEFYKDRIRPRTSDRLVGGLGTAVTSVFPGATIAFPIAGGIGGVAARRATLKALDKTAARESFLLRKPGLATVLAGLGGAAGGGILGGLGGGFAGYQAGKPVIQAGGRMIEHSGDLSRSAERLAQDLPVDTMNPYRNAANTAALEAIAAPSAAAGAAGVLGGLATAGVGAAIPVLGAVGGGTIGAGIGTVAGVLAVQIAIARKRAEAEKASQGIVSQDKVASGNPANLAFAQMIRGDDFGSGKPQGVKVLHNGRQDAAMSSFFIDPGNPTLGYISGYKAAGEIAGGLGDGKPDSAFRKDELAKGVEIEKEHTDDPALAKKITKDHLAEIPDYNTRLKHMEAEAEDVETKENGKEKEASGRRARFYDILINLH